MKSHKYYMEIMKSQKYYMEIKFVIQIVKLKHTPSQKELLSMVDDANAMINTILAWQESCLRQFRFQDWLDHKESE